MPREKESIGSSSSNQRQRPTPAAEPYPWRRVVFGCLIVLLCWGIGIYRQNKVAADAKAKQLQDWAFSKLWSHMSTQNAERVDIYRKPLWAQVQGNVFEIGAGHGEPLMLLPRGTSALTKDGTGVRGITHYVAAEPNAFLHTRLAENAAAAGFSVQYDANTSPDAAEYNAASAASKLPVLTIVNGTLDNAPTTIPKYIRDHGPYDYAIGSMVMCSVDNVQANLQAIQDLLVPGGKFIFIEHVRHTDEADSTVSAEYQAGSMDLSKWRRVQDMLTSVWPLLTGNCHLDRDTGKLIREMKGWSSVEMQTHRGTSGVLDKLTPLVFGIATKATA
ncbi:hypothetical protein H4R24_004853 [Coemansia sp. RSA 988]|nr:hypothetical protein H4R24_004853 [Coemansia sp. RSA 988]